jgi:hypothetical protein
VSYGDARSEILTEHERLGEDEELPARARLRVVLVVTVAANEPASFSLDGLRELCDSAAACRGSLDDRR